MLRRKTWNSYTCRTTNQTKCDNRYIFRGGRALAELRVVVALYKPVVVIDELTVEGEKLDAFLFRERQTGTDDCVMSGKGG